MGLGLAIKAFFKAFREPNKAEVFLNEPPKQIENFDTSHLRLLGILQHSGRLIDFFKEDISTFSDAQVGAAVRKIHEDCAKSLEEFVTVRPLMDENEGSTIRVQEGYDVEAIRLVGNVKGNPPYQGVLMHKGWKAHKRSLPKKLGGQASTIICPAEVEIR